MEIYSKEKMVFVVIINKRVLTRFFPFQLIQKDKTTPQEYAWMKEEYSNEEYLQGKLKKAEAQGIEKGNKHKQLEIAKKLLDVLDIKIIALKTGLSEENIKKLR